MKLVDIRFPAAVASDAVDPDRLPADGGLSERETVRALAMLLRFGRLQVAPGSEFLDRLARQPGAKLAILRLAQTLPQMVVATRAPLNGDPSPTDSRRSLEIRAPADLVHAIFSDALAEVTDESRRPVPPAERTRGRAVERFDEDLELSHTVEVVDRYGLGRSKANDEGLRALVERTLSQCRRDGRARRFRLHCTWPVANSKDEGPDSAAFARGFHNRFERAMAPLSPNLTGEGDAPSLMVSILGRPWTPHDRSVLIDGVWRVDLGKGLAGLVDGSDETSSFEYHFRYAPTRVTAHRAEPTTRGPTHPGDRWRELHAFIRSPAYCTEAKGYQ